MSDLMEHTTLTIDGMTCGHCVSAVRQALDGVDGATVESVAVGSATVAYDPARTSPERLAAAVTEEGYAASTAATAVGPAGRRQGGCGCGCG
jgi:copper chaperone